MQNLTALLRRKSAKRDEDISNTSALLAVVGLQYLIREWVPNIRDADFENEFISDQHQNISIPQEVFANNSSVLSDDKINISVLIENSRDDMVG